MGFMRLTVEKILSQTTLLQIKPWQVYILQYLEEQTMSAFFPGAISPLSDKPNASAAERDEAL